MAQNVDMWLEGWSLVGDINHLRRHSIHVIVHPDTWDVYNGGQNDW